MRKKALCTLAALLATGTSVSGWTAPLTFVASNGLDVNPCTRTLPCRSFTRALAVTDTGGEVIVIDSGEYAPFTVSRSASIRVPEGVYAGIPIPPALHGIVVDGPNIRVSLHGLNIDGAGGDDGIRVVNALEVLVDSVVIAAAGNGSSDAGIRVATGLAQVTVTDTTVRGGAGYGIQLSAGTVRVYGSRIESNAGPGILGQGSSGRIAVHDSFVARNGAAGIRTVASPNPGTWQVDVSHSVVDGNAGWGIYAGSGNGGTYRLNVTDSVLRNNAGGVGLVANAGETGTALVGENRVVLNGTGILCAGAGSGVLVAERNDVAGNVGGLTQRDACTFRTLRNNAVATNTTDAAGVFTPASLR